MTVTNPIAGRYYSLSVHGEPPEGVEVLWTIDEAEWVIERDCLDRDTHWMLAPQLAPEPAEAEEPPFPLSRGEWEEAARNYRAIALMQRRGLLLLERWWRDWSLPLCDGTEYDYSTVVSAWRAAGCPGAERVWTQEEVDEMEAVAAARSARLEAPEAPEVDAEEGPWKYGHAGGYITLNRRPEVYTTTKRERVQRLISDANDAHRLRGELEKARAKAMAYGNIVHGCSPALEAAGHKVTEKANIAAAVRSLVSRAEKAEEERDAAKRQKQAVQAELDTMSAKLARQASRVRAFADIGHERFKQDQKWGDQSDKGDAVFCAILGEEFGEVCQAFLQEKPTHEIREELVQTAAVAVQWIEILDRRASHAGEGE